MPGRYVVVLLICISLFFSDIPGFASAVPVRYREGSLHGFLVLSTLDGTPLASGDLVQVPHANRITNHLVFRFKDGSLHDETAVYDQRRDFMLVSYHLIQKGPAFQHPLEVSFESRKRQVTVRYSDGDGKEKLETHNVDLPPDLANGLILTLMKNIRPDALETKVSLLAATPKPRVVRLAITPQGEEDFAIAGLKRKATHFVVKVEIPGAAGVVAGVLGKQPPDSDVWILSGEAPAFVKSEGPLFLGGPIWRIELVSPVWPRTPAPEGKN